LQNSRMSVLAEPIGGGFKLKLLEYIFNRVPIAALGMCVDGLPPSVQEHMLLADDIPSLVTQVVARIDQIDRLNAMQNAAFAAADPMFDWHTKGINLMREINESRCARH